MQVTLRALAQTVRLLILPTALSVLQPASVLADTYVGDAADPARRAASRILVFSPIAVDQSDLDETMQAGTPSLEDFEGGATPAGTVGTCVEPVSAASNDACFVPGQLKTGFTVRSGTGAGVIVINGNSHNTNGGGGLTTNGNSHNPNGGGGLITNGNAHNPNGGGGFTTNGNAHNLNAVVGAALSGDATVVEFSPAVTAFALDILGYGIAVGGRINVAIYDESDALVSFMSPQVPNIVAGLQLPAPLSLTITHATPLKRMELSCDCNAGVALIDNLRVW